MSRVLTTAKATPRSAPARGGSVPAYQRIEGELRARIGRGEWMVGTMLPSRQRLSGEYGVNLGTIQRALSALLADGTVRAEEGRGTFIAERGAVTPRLNGEPGYEEGTRSTEVGVILCAATVSPDWHHRLLHSLEMVLAEKNRRLRLLCLGWERVERMTLSEGISQLADQGVGAVAVIDIHNDIMAPELMPVLQGWERGPLPLILLTAASVSYPVPHLFYNHEAAGMQAAHHLLENGWEELAFIGPFSTSWQEERIAGVCQALGLARADDPRLPIYPDAAERIPNAHGGAAEEAGHRAAQPLLERIAMSEAVRFGIICANDKIARGVMRGSRERGLVPGEDFGIIGFDDDPESRLVGLSSLHPPLESLGQELGYLLEQSLAGRVVSHQVRLRSHLMARESSLGA